MPTDKEKKIEALYEKLTKNGTLQIAKDMHKSIHKKSN